MSYIHRKEIILHVLTLQARDADVGFSPSWILCND